MKYLIFLTGLAFLLGCKNKSGKYSKEYTEQELRAIMDSNYKEQEITSMMDSTNAGYNFNYNPKVFPVFDTCIKYKEKGFQLFLKESCSKTLSPDAAFYFETLRIYHHKYPNLLTIDYIKPLQYQIKGRIISIDLINFGITNTSYSFKATITSDTVFIKESQEYTKGVEGRYIFKVYQLKFKMPSKKGYKLPVFIY